MDVFNVDQRDMFSESFVLKMDHGCCATTSSVIPYAGASVITIESLKHKHYRE